ncbi:hypothetical protein EVAR_28417_1 [Eumeta japonica]|uniref:Protein kinase domain-containing protein n=1 Tax=Eumeta variegata TaxID=151549 RepID=A0A4C1V977_EUMVA|nr:hypothetical protein EVAR_28417_1 [Eumeta japonica]
MRAVLGRYKEQSSREHDPPVEGGLVHTMSEDVWSLGQVLWEICSWEEASETGPPLSEPTLPCLYRPQLYQIMQCCWNFNCEDRPTAEHIYIMLNHLYTNGLRIKPDLEDLERLHEVDDLNESILQDDGYISSQFEERWQSLKPNSIPTLDEHRVIVHAPSTSRTSHFTNSDQDFEDHAHGIQDSLSTDIETAVSRSSSIMSDRDPLSVHIKSESLTNLHGSLEDVRNIYLTHSENAVAEDHEQNPAVVGPRSYQDYSDSSDINKVDPWLKDIISDSQDDVSYFRDVSDVIKNLDNILNSEKTSSSESSHQASPSRDALTLDCKKDYPVQSSLVKSPGISNFQSILEATPEHKVNEDIRVETTIEEEIDRETIGTLNHSFERHSESNSQHTDDTLSPDTPLDAKSQKDFEVEGEVFIQNKPESDIKVAMLKSNDTTRAKQNNIVVNIPNLRDLCIASVKSSLSNIKSERAKCQNEDCGVLCDKDKIIKPLDTSNTNFSLSKSIDCMPNESQDVSVISSTQVSNIKTLDMREVENIIKADEPNTELNKANVICKNESSSNIEQQSVHITNDTLRSESDEEITLSKHITSDDSTGYMDLTNETVTRGETESEIRIGHNVEPQQLIETNLNQSPLIPVTSDLDSTASTSTAPIDVNLGIGSFQAEIIKFNLTTRLAMAENENNLNIEQSGPRSIEEYLTNNSSVPIVADECNGKDSSSAKETETETTCEVPALMEQESHVLYGIESDNSCIILNADDTTSSSSPILLIAEASVLKELSEIDTNAKQTDAMSISNPENLIYIVPESILAGNGGIENETQSVLSTNSESIVVQSSSDDPSTLLFENNALPESILAGSMPNACDQFDESDMWSGELPPPPELIVNYPGALSPIAEETRQQLNAYENQIQWDTSENNRTDSSESYPEPCNDSTAEVTDMITAVISGQPDDHTYTVHSDPTQPSVNNTYTIQKEATTSKELTMSVDSLNVSGSKQMFDVDTLLNNDKTFSVCKDDDCEKLSQVSPFMLSPTTESSIPEPSDNGPGASTVSKTTALSDTKSTKPSETQCLSKATSIDSWCSNDTLFNVEDNFDDLAMDSDVPLEYDVEKDVNRSNSTGTLTDHDGDKENSHCSTYIVHDSKSDAHESFTPDSITVNHTYTKPKTEEDKISPTLLTKSDVNDSSAKNTPTRDLAYGTLISGCNSNLASHSNCTTEIFSCKDDPWKIHPQVEMVRHTVNAEELVNITPPIITDLNNEESLVDGPKVKSKPHIKKLDSIDISCLHDNINFEHCNSEAYEAPSLDYHLVNMGNSVTSTPIYPEHQVDTENVLPVPMVLPKNIAGSSFDNITGLPNLQSFFYSAELRPQDIDSPIVNDTDDLLEPEKQLLSGSNVNTSSKVQDTYSDFEFSAAFKPQSGNSQETNFLHSHCESVGSGSDEFHQFENSVKCRPQDLSIPVQISPKSEIKKAHDEHEINEIVNTHEKLENNSSIKQEEQSNQTSVRRDETNFEDINDLQEINYLRTLEHNNIDSFPNKFDVKHIVPQEISSSSSSLPPLNIVTSDDISNIDESEHEQPHSIIITGNSNVNTSKNVLLVNTYDSHVGTTLQLNETFDPHSRRDKKVIDEKNEQTTPVVNGQSHDRALSLVNTVQESNAENVSVSPQIIKENGITSGEDSAHLGNEALKSGELGITCKTNDENFATVNFLIESFEELPTSSNKIDSDNKISGDLEKKSLVADGSEKFCTEDSSSGQLSIFKERAVSLENITLNLTEKEQVECNNTSNQAVDSKQSPEMSALTEDFLEKEKNFCQFSTYLPLLGDIRFTGPGSDIMSTSFNQESPTEEQSAQTEQSKQPDATSDEFKEWDSDTDDSQSTNSSSGEFIWKVSIPVDFVTL